MITIENKTSGASFRYQDDKFNMSGRYTINEDKTFQNLAICINKADNGVYKGGADLQGEELLYNFTQVKPSETAEIAEHCEMCFAELKENI